MDTGYGVKIPKGTIVHAGDIAPQGRIFLGGTKQVLVETPWRIKGIEVVEQFSLEREEIWQHMMR